MLTAEPVSKSLMGGKTDLSGVTAYIPREWKEELEQWAKEEERSMSWLLSKLVENALKERREKKNQSK